MSEIAVGQTIPAFTATATNNLTIHSKDFRNQQTILYFYPKDNTPGCTDESIDFATSFKKFEKINTVIYGISRDSLKSHERFKEKLALPFELISDSDEILVKIFDVLKQKNMYGKKVFGIERSTFLFDSKGKLANEWRKVKVPGHVEEVLATAIALTQG